MTKPQLKNFFPSVQLPEPFRNKKMGVYQVVQDQRELDKKIRDRRAAIDALLQQKATE